MAESQATDWTSAADVRVVLDRRWRSGALLRGYVTGEPLAPFSLPVRRPGADDLLERRSAVEDWLHGLARGCATTTRRPGLRIESTPVTSRWVGRNDLPRRIWVDSYEALFGWLGVEQQVATVEELLAHTASVSRRWSPGRPRIR